MGEFANPRWVKVLAWLVTGIIVVLNAYLLIQTLVSWAT
jgi:manganese transport protein